MCDRIDAETAAREGAPTVHPEFDRLVRTIWRLRQPDGCPWDKAQTFGSLTRNMIEEAYETSDAMAAADIPHIREELGDVLEQVLLNAQIGEDGGDFGIDDVCRELNEKLVRRHPHIFGDPAEFGAVDSAGRVLDIWDDVKKQERADGYEPAGLLDSIPRSFPALLQCQKISKRAAKAGFEWDTVDDVWDQFESEHREFLAEEPGSEGRAMEFGDMLFSLVNVARREGIDAEEALEAANAKFRRRWGAMERMAAAEGRGIDSYTTEELNVLWNRVKAGE
jgi:tetrapyrrole methylase family protein/MazG family protein